MHSHWSVALTFAGFILNDEFQHFTEQRCTRETEAIVRKLKALAEGKAKTP